MRTVLPSGWDEVRLEDLVAEGPSNGYSPKSTPDAKGTPSLRLNATTKGRLILTEHTTRRLSEVIPENSRYWLVPGDLLVQRSNTLKYLGAAAIYDGPAHAYIYPDTIMRLRLRDGVSTRWVWRCLNSPSVRRYFRRVAGGTAGSMPKINGTKLRATPILLPPLAEQRRIADILDKADAIRRKRLEAIRLTEDLLRSTFLEMFGDPVLNPKEWPTATLGQLIPRKGDIVDGPFGSSLKPERYVGSGVCVVRNRNIFDDRFDATEFKYVSAETFVGLRRSEVCAGDLLLSTKGTIGSMCSMPDISGPALLSASGTVRLRLPDGCPVRPEVVVQQMIQPNFKRYMKGFEAGTNQKYLNLSGIRNMSLIIPPHDLQHRFVAVRSSSRAQLAKAHSALAGSDDLFLSLTQRAFRGEL